MNLHLLLEAKFSTLLTLLLVARLQSHHLKLGEDYVHMQSEGQHQRGIPCVVAQL